MLKLKTAAAFLIFMSIMGLIFADGSADLPIEQPAPETTGPEYCQAILSGTVGGEFKLVCNCWDKNRVNHQISGGTVQDPSTGESKCYELLKKREPSVKK